MSEYNRLTRLLIDRGYNAYRYPDFVRIPADYNSAADPLDNPYGGFEYRRDYIQKASFQTGCGLYAMGESCIDNLEFMGMEWCYENDNPVILCPYYKYDCDRNHVLLRQPDGERKCLCFCVCHRTDVYEYEKSLEYVQNRFDEEKKRLYDEFIRKNSHVCPVHAVYNEKEKTWHFRYKPVRCASGCRSTFCPVRGKPISAKKGNVFYDLIVRTRRKDDTFFNGEPVVSIIKGKRFLPKPASIDICREIAKTGAKQIWEKEWWNQYSTWHIYDPDLEIEIQNVRAEAKESRDLMKDLEDIRNGIAVVHESDREKQEKEAKREQRKRRKEKK